MKIDVLFGSESFESDERYLEMRQRLREKTDIRLEKLTGALEDDVDMLMSVGGDGTYLSAVSIAAKQEIPVVGVNLGRIGFLSENEPMSVCESLINNTFTIKEMPLLAITAEYGSYTAFNELCVMRSDSSALGIEVSVNGMALPTYWADGLLVSTPSGSTAYSLSVGGPIIHPSSKVLVLSPIAPHNLNVRPLVVPQECKISIKFVARCNKVLVSVDNRTFYINAASSVDVCLSPYTHKRVCLPESNFIKALSDKLFWGKDKRNERN